MNCPKCNAFNMNSAKFCSHCGASFEAPPQNQQPNQNNYGGYNQGGYNQNGYNQGGYNNNQYQGTYQQNQQYTYNQQYQNYPNNNQAGRTSGKAIASLVLSLVGIIIAGLICGILGIILAVTAFNEMNKNPAIKGKGIATTGLVISIIDCVLMFIFISNGMLFY